MDTNDNRNTKSNRDKKPKTSEDKVKSCEDKMIFSVRWMLELLLENTMGVNIE
jgi:hypothetical protein